MGTLKDQLADLKDKLCKNKDPSRKQKLLALIERIEKGEFDSSPVILDKLFNQNAPRMQYVSPLDRGTQNYGYTDIGEMSGSTENIQ
jgi:hypothetical protein